jgi:transposase, IS5 family
MFKILILQTLYTLSDDAAEFQIRDCFSLMRFLGARIARRGYAKTIWLFREQLTKAGAVDECGGMAISTLGSPSPGRGRAVRAIGIAGAKAKNGLAKIGINVDASKNVAFCGLFLIPSAWGFGDGPMRRQSGLVDFGMSAPIFVRRSPIPTDRRARGRPEPRSGRTEGSLSTSPSDLRLSEPCLDRRGFGLIRTWRATVATAYEGARLREGLFDKTNTAGAAYADAANRSAANEAFLEKNGFSSRIHRKKPKGRPMRGDAPRQRAEVESPLARRAYLRRAEGRMGGAIRGSVERSSME